MANFDVSKNYDYQAIDIKNWSNHFCNKDFSKKFFITCCDLDFWFSWSNSFNSEKKYKKIFLSFVDINTFINQYEFLSIFWNIWPPWDYFFNKNNYNYISLTWIIKSNT